MKEKTVNQILDELEETLESTGVSVTQVVEAFIETRIPKQFRGFVRTVYRPGWESFLKSRPEPTKAQLAEGIAMIRAFKNAPSKMRALIKQKMKEMPHAPGGPPRKIKPEEERTVCAEITALRAQLDPREAIKRVAAKRGVSERTIYRVWGKYNPKKRKSRNPSNP